MILDSKPQTHSNAYIYGFFNRKYIVLYDTFLKDRNNIMDNKTNIEENSQDDKTKGKGKVMNDEEILAVLGHELGHWKLNHILFNFIISQVFLFFWYRSRFLFNTAMHFCFRYYIHLLSLLSLHCCTTIQCYIENLDLMSQPIKLSLVY